MHEQGLAVDFSVNGRFLTSRTDPAFLWLAANARPLGLLQPAERALALVDHRRLSACGRAGARRYPGARER